VQEITPEVVRHVALLSRLELEPGEAERYAGELDKILHYVEKLKELDTTNVEPTSHSFRMENVFREDVVRPSLTNEEALANAPDSEEGCFKVPAVLQEGGGA
jgi:aspartyl-tRNA(Asn)/glutamyl-tRNA(Gln) amidotransferase subunit C